MNNKYVKAILINFYPNSRLILLNNYTNESFARSQKDKYSIGMWKIKKLK